MKEKETKRERFIRVAEKRVNKALKIMELLGNCSNTKVYEYTEQDAKAIIKALEKSIASMKERFDSNAKTKERFHLDL